MKRYLITGFSGFVGFHFISTLNNNTSENVEVLGMDFIEPYDFQNWCFPKLKISFVKIDLLQEQQLNSIITEFKPDYILHLAALSSVGKSWEDPALCFKNNTNVFINIIETIRKESLNTKLLSIGSSEEYGYISDQELPLKENCNIQPCNPYAVTKVAQEYLSACYVDKFDMDICSTRSFNHIGPRQRDVFVIASFCKQVAEAYLAKATEMDMTVGNLSVVRDFLDVRDVALAYYKILLYGKKGELYNVCSGIGYKLNDIIDLLTEISGVKINTIVNPNLIRPNDIPKIIGCNNKLKNDTGWKPVYDIKTSLKDTFDYWVRELSK